MDIVDRVKKICLSPDTEWPVIAGETTPAGTLMTGYVIPLAAIGAVAGFIGGSVIGYDYGVLGNYRVPLVSGIVRIVLSIAMSAIGVFLLSMIIDALAPTFGAVKNQHQALKLAVYSATPAWLAGIFQLLPVLAPLAILGALYSLYLLYLGIPRLMKCPEDKTIPYIAVVVVCAVILGIVVSRVTGMAVGAGVPVPAI